MKTQNGWVRCFVFGVLVSLIVGMGVLPLWAGEENTLRTWFVNTGDEDQRHRWDRAPNWKPSGTPNEESQVVIPTGTPWVGVNKAAKADALELSGSSSELRINSAYDLSVGATVVSNGKIIVDPGRTVSAGTLFTQNDGAFTDLNGTLTAPVIDVWGGNVVGDGWLNGPVRLSGGTLSGNLKMTSLMVNDGTVDVVDPSSQLHHMAVNGLLSMNGGVLDVTGLEGGLGQVFTVLTYGSHEGSFRLVSGDPDGGGPLSWKEAYGANALTLTATKVPTPSSLSLIGLGLACLIAVRRRRSATKRIFD